MSQHIAGLKLFAGNSNPPLAEEISQYLKVPLGKSVVETFSDGESKVEIKENVRGTDVFVLQSTSAPGNDNLMELLLMLDAFKRASANRITAVIPYYGYARQDRKVIPRVPISAKLVADLITTAGASRMLTMAADALEKKGAKKSLGCCTHPVLSGPAIQRIAECPLEELIVTNTIPLGPEAKGCNKIKVLSVAHLIGEAIRRTHEEESISSLFV